tara:strand:- start:243 stop:386 length:144 start_codon:yes stop_codon:yes gene_type:complete
MVDVLREETLSLEVPDIAESRVDDQLPLPIGLLFKKEEEEEEEELKK